LRRASLTGRGGSEGSGEAFDGKLIAKKTPDKKQTVQGEKRAFQGTGGGGESLGRESVKRGIMCCKKRMSGRKTRHKTRRKITAISQPRNVLHSPNIRTRTNRGESCVFQAKIPHLGKRGVIANRVRQGYSRGMGVRCYEKILRKKRKLSMEQERGGEQRQMTTKDFLNLFLPHWKRGLWGTLTRK